MDKINRPVRNLSLRKSFILYVVVFAMLALVLSIMTISICDKTADKIDQLIRRPAKSIT